MINKLIDVDDTIKLLENRHKLTGVSETEFIYSLNDLIYILKSLAKPINVSSQFDTQNLAQCQNCKDSSIPIDKFPCSRCIRQFKDYYRED